MKLSAGEVGVSVAMLPFSGGQRSVAGSVWVRVVSAVASCLRSCSARREAPAIGERRCLHPAGLES